MKWTLATILGLSHSSDPAMASHRRVGYYLREHSVEQTVSAEIDSVKEAILSLVNEEWEKKRHAVLLTHVGSFVRRHGLWPLRETAITISQFVRTNMAGLVRLESNPIRPLDWGLFPVDAVLEKDVSQYFVSVDDSDKRKVPFYEPFLWAAFAKPVLPGTRRFMDVRKRVFVDAPTDAEQPFDTTEVLAEDVPAEEIPNRANEIAAKVQEWGRRNGVELSEFEIRKRASDMKPLVIRHQTLLDRVLDALSDRDLARIQMPLDIVSKLRRQQG